jgi:hypothetical protein
MDNFKEVTDAGWRVTRFPRTEGWVRSDSLAFVSHCIATKIWVRLAKIVGDEVTSLSLSSSEHKFEPRHVGSDKHDLPRFPSIGATEVRQVVECASPLALSHTKKLSKRQRTARTPRRWREGILTRRSLRPGPIQHRFRFSKNN